jgi:hypothetical protein
MSFRPALWLAAFAAAVAPASAQFQDFTGWTGFDVGSTAQVQFAEEFELADLDGDGHPDLVVTSWGLSQHKLVVRRNLGDQSFGAPAYLPLIKGSMDVAVADLDGDGDLDLAATEGGNDHSGNSVAIFRNGGAANFSLAQRVTVTAGLVGIAAGDFDGDGDRDLATAIAGIAGSGTSVRRLVNDGGGSFTPGSSATVSGGPYALAAGDVDGDGRVDLAVGHEATDVVDVLRSTGAAFAAPISFNVKASTESGAHLFPSVALVDLDLDGDLDVAFSDNTHQKSLPLLRGIVTTLRNQGGGAFVLGPDIVLRPGASGFTDMAFADLNQDGWPDVLGVDHQDWDFALSNGAGGYVQPSEINYGFLATDEPTAIATLDADRDGDLDALVLGSHSVAMSVHRFEHGAPLQGAAATPGPDGDIDAADIDGDGDLDLAGGGGGFIGVLRNLGDGSFGPLVNYSSGAFGGPKGVKLRDLNGDGRPDLVIGALSGFNTRLNLGNGDFGNLVQWVLPICGIDDIDLADLDHDGDLDVIIPESAGCPNVPTPRVFVVAGKGDGTFLQPAGQAFTSTGLSTAVTHADVDLDGHEDIVLGQNSWLEIYRGNGNLTFQPRLQVPMAWGPHSIVAADFNADGLPDLASCNWGGLGNDFSAETTTIALGFGNGSFGPAQLLPAGFSWDLGSASAIQAGDIDRDGDMDLAVANFDSHDVSLYRNVGDGSFLPQTRVGGALTLTDIVLDDFTGDGLADLALAGQPALITPPSIVLLRGLGNDPWLDLGPALAGSDGLPHLGVDGALVPGAAFAAHVSKARPLAAGSWVVGATQLLAAFKGGVLVPQPTLLLPFFTSAQGETQLAATMPAGIPAGSQLVLQAWIADPAGPAGFAATNGAWASAP